MTPWFPEGTYWTRALWGATWASASAASTTSTCCGQLQQTAWAGFSSRSMILDISWNHQDKSENIGDLQVLGSLPASITWIQLSSQPPSSSRNFSAIPRKQSWHLSAGKDFPFHRIIGKRCFWVDFASFLTFTILYMPTGCSYWIWPGIPRISQVILTHIHHLSSQGLPGLTLLVARSSTWKQCIIIIIIITSNVAKTIINHPQMGCLLLFYLHYYYLVWWLLSW